MPGQIAQQVPLPASPSLLFNNLSASGDDLLYTHKKEVYKLGTAQKHEPIKVGGKPSSLVVQQARFCHFEEITVLVVALEGCVQVWDVTGLRLLFSWAIPPAAIAPAAATPAPFARGIAANVSEDGGAQICVGTSSGGIAVFSVSDGCRINFATMLKHHKQPIMSLGSAIASTRGQVTTDVTCALVSSDEDGALSTWEAVDSATYTLKHSTPGVGVPCTTVAVWKEMLLAGFLNGLVRIHSLVDGALLVEVQAHSRFLSALDVHPTRNIFATASEDCTVNVWSIPTSPLSKVENLLSVCWNNAMVTGVAFCGEDSNGVAVAAFDTDEIKIWSI